MTTALVLKYFDFTKPAILKMDFSNYINSGILFQLNTNSLLYPVAFYNKNFDFAKCNYNIYNKEFLAIIYVLKK